MTYNTFDSISSKQWKQKIQYELNGTDYLSVIWESIDPISVRPFYHPDEILKKHLSPTKKNAFNVCQKIYVSVVEKSITRILKNHENGVNSFVLIIPNEQIDCINLLKGLPLADLVIYLDLQFLSANYCAKIIDAFTTNNIFIINDPIHHLTQTGNWFVNKEIDLKEINTLNINKAKLPFLAVKLTGYQNAGASCVQQLAFALAHVNEYFTELKPYNASIVFEVAIGGNYFFEIAKLKALRLLFATLAKEYSVTDQCQIIATPSQRNKTLFLHETNLVRNATEYMSAILGGADTVLTQTADFMFKKDNTISNRLAKNQLLLLKEESLFDGVGTPIDGVYYIDYLTQQMVDKALLLFKEIERKGGFLKLLKEGFIQQKIEETANKEQQLFDSQQEILVGGNKYADINKVAFETELYPFSKTNPRKTLIKPIIEKRLSEEWEKKLFN